MSQQPHFLPYPVQAPWVLLSYNTIRWGTSLVILIYGGKFCDRGWVWYYGKEMLDGHPEEFGEDMQQLFKDLSSTSLRSLLDSLYTYNFANIDNVLGPLSYRWKTSKDTMFYSFTLFIGFE